MDKKQDNFKEKSFRNEMIKNSIRIFENQDEIIIS